jgi:hypothetical protein
MIKTLAVATLALASINAAAQSNVESAIAGAALMGIFMDAKNARTPPPASTAIMYPVPVHQPPAIVVPRCTPNVPCPTTIVIQCSSLPIFDTYGRIISYYQSCH